MVFAIIYIDALLQHMKGLTSKHFCLLFATACHSSVTCNVKLLSLLILRSSHCSNTVDFLSMVQRLTAGMGGHDETG